MNNENVKKDNDTKKIVTLLVLIATVMVTTTGATYAYFALSAISNNTMNGVAATASLQFSVAPTYIAPTTTANQSLKMIPQKSFAGTNGTTNVLQNAFVGTSTKSAPTNKDKCIDDNGNLICKAYSFTIKNTSTAVAIIKGQIKFTYASSSKFTNLKWKLMDSANSVTAASGNAGTLATTTYTNFATNLSLAVNGTKQYWIIFWIEETGAAQNSTDYGTWYATLQFINNTDGTGITSTIAS